MERDDDIRKTPAEEKSAQAKQLPDLLTVAKDRLATPEASTLPTNEPNNDTLAEEKPTQAAQPTDLLTVAKHRLETPEASTLLPTNAPNSEGLAEEEPAQTTQSPDRLTAAKDRLATPEASTLSPTNEPNNEGLAEVRPAQAAQSPDRLTAAGDQLATPEASRLLPKSTPNNEILVKVHEQYCHNARAYMDLRFKHFTTFMFLTGLLGAIAFQVEPLKSFRPLFCMAAIIFTILFWLLDYRTSYLQKRELNRIENLEQMLGVPTVSPPPERIAIRASVVTNLIFLMILLSWCYMSWKQERTPPTSTSTENASSERKKEEAPKDSPDGSRQEAPKESTDDNRGEPRRAVPQETK